MTGPGGRDDIRAPGAIDALDRATTWVEKPVRRLAGSARLNPLPHAGTISVFLLGVVVLSGVYITLFFEYGHVASYESVASMEGHAIQRVVRALHRYSSAALVVTSLIHGWRILTAGRFVGHRRRYRWATGVASVMLVWLTGVTGYWLVWDVRAQALNEIVVGLVGDTGPGARFAIGNLGVAGDRFGSGSSFLVVMWFAHLGLTAAIGYFTFRHLRHSNLPWLPPRHLMAVMGGALVFISLVLPLGMLAPAAADQQVGSIPVDPFVLFLLPPLLSEARWLVVVAAAALMALAVLLPRILRRSDPPVVVVDEDACTGCDLCVIDCPYQALSLTEPASTASAASGAGEGASPVAVVDARRCVSCGICLGSCAFGAIELPGHDPQPPLQLSGGTLVLACDRHPEHDVPSTSERAVHRVGCAGMVAPQTVRLLADRGAESVQVLGCAPHDCRYGLGNTLAAERLSGQRRPHPAARYAKIVTQDWVPTDRVARALESPGLHPVADGSTAPRRREALVGVGAMTVLAVAAVALATQAPFEPATDQAEIRLVVDHQAGRPLRVAEGAGPVGPLADIELTVGGEPVAIVEGPGSVDRWSTIVDIAVSSELDSGLGSELESEPDSGLDLGRSTNAGPVAVQAVERSTGTVRFDGELISGPGARTIVDLTDVADPPTVADGRHIFTSRTGGCSVCHSVDRGDDGVGPSLHGVASVAGSRVEGLTAEQYLRQSILLPDQYVVDGWPSGQMLPIYRERLTPEQLDAVIAYLLTLEDVEQEDG
jgi:ferredoxin/mono/diheme cytochrome c family protein